MERYRFRQRTEVVPPYRMLNSIIGCLGYNWTLSIYPFQDINRQICGRRRSHSYDPLSLINIIVNRPINRYVRLVKRADGSSTTSLFHYFVTLMHCRSGEVRGLFNPCHLSFLLFLLVSLRFFFFFFLVLVLFFYFYFYTRLLLVYFISPFLTVSLIVLISTVWEKSGRINKCVCEEYDILN